MSNVADGIILFILFGVFVLGMVIIAQVFMDLTDGTNLVSAPIKASATGFFTSIDNMGIFLVLAIVGVTIGAAFLIRTNPIFFAVALLLLFVQFLILPPVVNSMNSIFASGGFNDGVSLFPNTIWLLGLSPILSFIGGGLAAVVALKGE